MNSIKQREVVYGGKAIAHEIEVLDGAGEPNLRKIYYMLEMGYVPGARKIQELDQLLDLGLGHRVAVGVQLVGDGEVLREVQDQSSRSRVTEVPEVPTL